MSSLSFRVLSTKVGTVTLSDGTILWLRVAVVDVRAAGFSPFAGVAFDVKAVGGVGIVKVPDDLKEKAKDKPLMPPEPPKEGWETIDIVSIDKAEE